MFGLTLAEIFMVGGLVISVLWAYFKVNELPKEWLEWKKISEMRLEKLEERQGQVEKDIRSFAGPFASLQATLESVEGRIQRVDDHLKVIMTHLITKGKGD